MVKVNHSELILLGQQLLAHKLIALFYLLTLFTCGRTNNDKMKVAVGEYRAWRIECNLPENLFQGPVFDSTFLNNSNLNNPKTFIWSYYRPDFTDTLRVFFVVEEGTFWLRTEVYRRGETEDWRKIVKSKY